MPAARIVGGQLLADPVRPRTQRLDHARRLAAAAPLEQLDARLLEPHARALVERVGRAVELAEHREQIDARLLEWGSSGDAARVVETLRARTHRICEKLPADDPGRRNCERFLSTDAKATRSA